MQMERRFAETVLAAAAVGAFIVGFHWLPPSPRETYVAEGPVHVLVNSPTVVEFSIADRKLEIHNTQSGFKQLRQALVEGAVLKVVGWPGGAWPNDGDEPLEVVAE